MGETANLKRLNLGYDPQRLKPMRDELINAGFRELLTAADADEFFRSERRTVLLFFNSVCGCSASSARPGVIGSLDTPSRPEVLVTVFAGQDKEAAERARAHLGAHPPSSPSAFILNGGQVVFALHRSDIEGRNASEVADELREAYGSKL